MTFWFLWSSSTVFRCPRFHLVATIRSELLPSHPQSLQLSNLIVLFIKLPKQTHSVTEQPILSKTQPRTARKDNTLAYMHCLNLLTFEHALHAPPRSTIISHALQAPIPRLHELHALEPIKLHSTSALGWRHPAQVIICVISLRQHLASSAYISNLLHHQLSINPH